jgi:hypothetical protein
VFDQLCQISDIFFSCCTLFYLYRITSHVLAPSDAVFFTTRRGTK